MYRLLVLLIRPFTALLLSLIVATLLLWRTPHSGRRRLIALSILIGLLSLICWPPVGYLAMASLEWSYPPRDDAPGSRDTIVVLSGSLRVYDREGHRYQLESDTAFRCLYARELYLRAGHCRMVVSGGKVEAGRPGPALAVAMREFLVQTGVRPEDILIEDQSTTTFENALECHKCLEPLGVHRVCLVTEAFHMRRAERCFRKQGFEVIPCACNHHATYFHWSSEDFLPDADASGGVWLAVHEWLGLAWYWLNGRI
jgi:uncharacterized SAM-binding protein YcdF (DUF218 family)